jgi:hypothetical protein
MLAAAGLTKTMRPAESVPKMPSATELRIDSFCRFSSSRRLSCADGFHRGHHLGIFPLLLAAEKLNHSNDLVAHADGDSPTGNQPVCLGRARAQKIAVILQVFDPAGAFGCPDLAGQILSLL